MSECIDGKRESLACCPGIGFTSVFQKGKEREQMSEGESGKEVETLWAGSCAKEDGVKGVLSDGQSGEWGSSICV